MPKAKCLIDAVKDEQPDKRTGSPAWHYTFRITSPDKMQQIDDLIDAWNSGDEALKRVRPSKQSLAKRINQELTETLKPESIVRYITERASRGTQG